MWAVSVFILDDALFVQSHYPCWRIMRPLVEKRPIPSRELSLTVNQRTFTLECWVWLFNFPVRFVVLRGRLITSWVRLVRFFLQLPAKLLSLEKLDLWLAISVRRFVVSSWRPLQYRFVYLERLFKIVGTKTNARLNYRYVTANSSVSDSLFGLTLATAQGHGRVTSTY